MRLERHGARTGIGLSAATELKFNNMNAAFTIALVSSLNAMVPRILRSSASLSTLTVKTPLAK